MSIQQDADAKALQITEGRYDLMAKAYCYPLPIWHRGGYHVAPSQREVWSFYQSLHSALHANGLHRVSALVTAVEVPIKNRVRVWTNWTGHRVDGSKHLFASTVCFRKPPAPSNPVSLLEFALLDLPRFAPFVV